MKGHEVLFSHKKDTWTTPESLFKTLNEEFSFDVDAAADEHNKLCSKFFSSENSGLLNSWEGNIFCNPPYSDIKSWVKKAAEEYKSKNNRDIVLLLPVRTCTKWFHEYLYNNANVEIRFIKGRLKFGDSKNSAPFPSMIVIFRGNYDK